jgi:hypothetical protein
MPEALKNLLKRASLFKTANFIWSAIIAVGLWYLVSITIYPETPKTFRDVEVVIDLEGTSASLHNLQVVSLDVSAITVQIRGQRSQVGNMKSEQLVAKVNVDEVTASGSYKLGLEISEKNGTRFDVLSVSPNHVNVFFDVYETRDIPLRAETPNVTFTPNLNLYRKDARCSQPVINVTAPKTILDSVSECVAVVLDDAEISDTTAWKVNASDLIFRNPNGIEIDKSAFTYNTAAVTVNVDVYQSATLKFDYLLRNKPEGFDESVLQFEWSSEAIEVASLKSNIGNRNTWTFDIDMLHLDPMQPLKFDIDLPANYENLSKITQVTARLVTENIDKKLITIPKDDFVIHNKPSDIPLYIVTDNIQFEIFGPKEDLERITAQDIKVEVDLFYETDISVTFSKTAAIIMKGFPRVWASGGTDGNNLRITLQPAR